MFGKGGAKEKRIYVIYARAVFPPPHALARFIKAQSGTWYDMQYDTSMIM